MHSKLLLAVAVLLCLQAVLVQCAPMHGGGRPGHRGPGNNRGPGGHSGGHSSGESSEEEDTHAAGPGGRAGPHHRECPFEDEVVCSAMRLCKALNPCRPELAAPATTDAAPATTEVAPADGTTDAAPVDVTTDATPADETNDAAPADETTDAAGPRPTLSPDQIEALHDAAEIFSLACPPCPTTTAAPTTEVTLP
jgi:hypothetical protein